MAHLFGARVEESLVAALRGMPDALRAAWAEAKVDPERAEDILEPTLAQLQRVSTFIETNLREAVERATRRGDADRRAIEAAERRIAHALGKSAAVTGQPDPAGFYVYLLWGESEDRPLYVGQSTNLYARLGSHMGDAAKRKRVKRIGVIRCATRHEMDKNELRLIQYYKPEMNKAGLPSERAA